MLTIFTVPKPFRTHIGIIQNNAIQSWLSLRPQPEVILLGSDEGTAETASKFGIRHVPDIECNEYGTPLVSSIFSVAQDTSTHQLMCYVNADIILLSDFMMAINQVRKKSFLIIGRRWDIDLKDTLNFNNTDWEANLRTYVKETGKLHGAFGLDYFVFPRGLYERIPPFAIGRTTWDNWLVYQARFLKVPVIDATRAITAIHQNHDYLHNPQGKTGVWEGPEAKRNLGLARGREHSFGLDYATHTLTPRGIKRALTMRHLYFRLQAIPVLFPPLHFLYKPIKALTSLIGNIRRKLGVTES